MSHETHWGKPELFYEEEEITRARQVQGRLDYRSERLPTWCPGCGYFGVETALFDALHELNIPARETVVVSGIGCVGRFPFFMKCYGIHTLHGRALPVATGAKLVRPELTVFALIGDGDGLGIGAGHFPHAARRNPDITCILFDNNIYGLTKGQTSPTTPHLQVTNSHPYGNPDNPLNAVLMALVYGATFVARGWAGRPKDLQLLISEAIKHRGFSFIHFLSPCVTFDKVNLLYSNLEKRTLPLPKRHDYTDIEQAIARARDPELFVGLFYKVERPTFAEQMRAYGERGKKV